MTREQAIKEMKETGALAVMKHTERKYTSPLPRPDMKIDLMPYPDYVEEHDYRVVKDWDEVETGEFFDYYIDAYNKDSKVYQRWLGMSIYEDDTDDDYSGWEVEVL